MDLLQAFQLLIDPVREGGYQDGAGDPGGETKWGISKRAHPDEDIKNLTVQRALDLYRAGYWGPAGCDAVPDGVKFDLFDAAVVHGPKRAVMFLQKAAAVAVDGQLGPDTLQAVNTAAGINLLRLLANNAAERLTFDSNLSNAHTASPAWMRRVAANMLRW